MIHILLLYKLVPSGVKSTVLAPYFQVSYQATCSPIFRYLFGNFKFLSLFWE